jgi:hypothetical protein
MKDTVIIALGTSAGAVALHLERLRFSERKRLRRQLASSSEQELPHLRKRLEDLDQSILIRAIDVDTSNVYLLPSPLFNEVPEWPVGGFIPVTMPGPDLVENIRQGRNSKFSFLNSEAFRSLDEAENASGGARPNGHLAACANAERIEREIRAAFRGILVRRQSIADPKSESVRAVLIAGLFGGFGTGTLDFMKRTILRIAEDLGLRLDLIQMLLLPGINPTKDPTNIAALTYAILKELAAESTRNLWRRWSRSSTDGPANLRSAFKPAILFSDANGAPGTPKCLPLENFNAAAGELLWMLTYTNLGAQVEAVGGDFAVAGSEITAFGESRFGRSMGISTIFLDRERQFEWSSARLAMRYLAKSQLQAEEAEIRRQARAFLESRRIVEGKGRRDLSEMLFEPHGGDRTTPERFRQLFRASISDLAGVDLLTQGRGRQSLALEQAGDFTFSFMLRKQAVVRSTLNAVQERLNQMAGDSSIGPAAAAQWLQIVGGIVEEMIGRAAEDSAALQEELIQLESNVKEIESGYFPAIESRNRVYAWLHAEEIERSAFYYARQLEEMTIAQMRCQAHTVAIEILVSLIEPLRNYLATVQAALQVIANEAARVSGECTRVGAFSPDFSCPIGLSLIKGENDLHNLHRRLLSEEDEEASVNDFFARLQSLSHPWEVLCDADRLREAISAAIEVSLRPRVDALHVVDELLHQYGSETDALGALLRERDLESIERLRLKDSSEHENGLILVRFVGMDVGRADSIVPMLNRFSYQRGVNYQPVDIGDPTRIVFIQYRSVFPFSDWAGFAAAEAEYQSEHTRGSFEKHHILAGDRFLPSPGQSMSSAFIAALAFRAFILGRLDFDDQRMQWILRSPDNGQSPHALGENFDSFDARDGYGRAVDLVSHYNCICLEHGPRWIEERLDLLSAISRGQAISASVADKRMAALLTTEAYQLLKHELEWWRKNTVPVAAEWGRAEDERSRIRVLSAG